MHTLLSLLYTDNRSKAHRIKKGAHTRHRSSLYTVPSNSRTDDSGVLSSSKRGEDNSITIHRAGSVPSTPASAMHKKMLNMEVEGVEAVEGGSVGTGSGSGSGVGSVSAGANASGAVTTSNNDTLPNGGNSSDNNIPESEPGGRSSAAPILEEQTP